MMIITLCALKPAFRKSIVYIFSNGRFFFYKNGPFPASFSLIFVFSNKHYNSHNKYMWKMLSPSSIQSLNPWPLEYESPPITTRPGLQWSFPLSLCMSCLHWNQKELREFLNWTRFNFNGTLVVAQLIEWLLLTLEVHGLNPVIGKKEENFMHSVMLGMIRKSFRHFLT